MKHIHHISLKHAWEGIVYVFTTQPNMRVHSLATFIVIILGFFSILLKQNG